MITTQEILKAAVERVGSLYKVAKLLGVKYTTAHAWKKGTSEPRAPQLYKLIELAGKTIAGVILCTLTSGISHNNSYANGMEPKSHQHETGIYIIRNYRSVRRIKALLFKPFSLLGFLLMGTAPRAAA